MSANATGINITINAGGNALSSLQQIGKAVADLEKQERRMSTPGKAQTVSSREQAAQKVAGAFQSAGSVFRSGQSGDAAVGAMGKFGGAPAVAAAALMAIEGAAKKATVTMEVWNDSTRTNAQKSEKLFDEFVPFGKTIRELGRAISGINDALLRANRSHETAMLRAHVQAQYTPQIAAASFAAQQSGSVISAISASRLDQYRFNDYSTVAGLRAAERQKTLLPLRDAQVRAQREAEAARLDVQNAGSRVASATKNANYREGESQRSELRLKYLRDLENSRGGARNELGINQAALQAERDTAAAVAAQAQKQAEIERSLEAQKKYSEAKTAAAQAQANYLRGELSLLQQMEQRMSSVRSMMGTMHSGQIQYGASLLNQIAEQGAENVPPQLLERARQFAPDYINKEIERVGEGKYKTDFLPGLSEQARQKIYGGTGEDSSTLAENRKKQEQVEVQLRTIIEIDADRVAKEISRIVGEKLAAIIANVSVTTEQQVRQQAIGRAKADNANR